MQFNSIEFLLFYPVVSILFFLLPQKKSWPLLLGASYFFYLSWRPKYITILLAVTLVSYLAGYWLEKEKRPKFRRLILSGSVLASVSALFFFKYFNFFNWTLDTVFEQFGVTLNLPAFNLLLPLGISFFTLQTISYTVDVYRGVTKHERNLGVYALFVSFFPQLAAGPIARGNQLIPQFHERHTPEYEKIVSGLQRMAWGFLKKLVIADRLALLVNTVYGNPREFSGLPLILATYAFAFQIYCDFSGYADIAIGAARVMGLKLVENFHQPYIAQSVPDFWRRWHISLSNWLRDYIFYPVSRALIRRNPDPRSWLNLIIPPIVTMVVSGLWHGANWTFVFWGALHGGMMVLAVVWGRAQKSIKWPFSLPRKLTEAIKIIATFNAITFTWIFFRANSLSDSVYIVQHLFVGLQISPSLFDLLPGGIYEWSIALLAIIIMETVHWLQAKNGGMRDIVRRQPLWVRWPIYFGLVLVIFMFGKFGVTEFIYGQF